MGDAGVVQEEELVLTSTGISEGIWTFWREILGLGDRGGKGDLVGDAGLVHVGDVGDVREHVEEVGEVTIIFLGKGVGIFEGERGDGSGEDAVCEGLLDTEDILDSVCIGLVGRE